MRAIIYTTYGAPDVLQLVDREKPTPLDNQVLIKIMAASANPLDWHAMRGAPLIARLSSGLFKPKNALLGADLAGRVEAVGKSVTQLRVGDEVFGLVGAGSFAEYVCANEDQVVLKPAQLSFEAAAAAPVAAITALQGLRDKGQIRPGQRVLVNGASGGVGSFAVQIAKSYGTEVTGVCSTRNLDLVRSIGADHVIDYTRQDFTQTGQRYDLIFDAVGNRSVADYQRALAPRGITSVAGFTTLSRLFEVIAIGAWVSRSGDVDIGIMDIAKPNKADLLVLQEMLATGKISSLIDRVYPLHAAAEAIRYLETSRARGKVILSMMQ